MWPKYKDAAPDETIKRISQALNEVGVHMEATFLEPVANVVSVLLADPEHGFETYGKGTSRKWALASAYGEAAERFQNRMLYESPAYAPDDKAPFYEWPDEERVTLHKALQSPFIAEDFSRHFTDDSSYTGQINSAEGENVIVPPQIADMLSKALSVCNSTGGALDLSIYPLYLACFADIFTF